MSPEKADKMLEDMRRERLTDEEWERRKSDFLDFLRRFKDGEISTEEALEELRAKIEAADKTSQSASKSA